MKVLEGILIKTRVFEVPSGALAAVGLDALKTEGTESSLQQTFEPEQVKLFLDQLNGVPGAHLIAETGLSTTDGDHELVKLWAPCGPGGATIMLKGEDAHRSFLINSDHL